MQKHIFYNLWCATDKIHSIKLEYDKSKKIKDQILFEQGHVKLLNVSKSYCDNIYQGVWFLFLVDEDFLKLFKAGEWIKESEASNLNSLVLNKYFLKIVADINESISYNRTTTTESFNFTFNNQKVRCDKVYVEGKYMFTNYHTNNIVQRGAYSILPVFSSSGRNMNQCDGSDNTCIIDYYKNKSVPNLANTITLTSTTYSTITYD